MNINPTFLAGALLKELFNEGDQIYGLQRVTTHFEQAFNDRIFGLASAGRPVRALYLYGREIGDPDKNGEHRYYLLIS